MRIFLLLLILIPLLALGLDLYFKDRQETRDARLVATANRVLIDAAGPTGSTKNVEIRRITKSGPRTWTVQGHITLVQAKQEERAAYSVEIEQRCSDLRDEACWHPRGLVLGERSLLSQSDAPPPPEVASPQVASPEALGPGAGPADAAPKAAEEVEPAPAAAGSTAFETTIGEESGPMPAPPGPAESPQAAEGAGQSAPDGGASEDQPAVAQPVEMSVEESLIWLIQDRLSKLGYGEPGTLRVTGKMDAATMAAIDAYQYANGLARNGQPSFDLLDHIEVAMARRSQAAPDAQSTAAQAEPAAPGGAATATASDMVPAPALAPNAPADAGERDADTGDQAGAAAAEAPPATDMAGTPAPSSGASSGPSWDTGAATGTSSLEPAGLEEQVAPAAGVSGDAEEQPPAARAQGDAEPAAERPEAPRTSADAATKEPGAAAQPSGGEQLARLPATGRAGPPRRSAEDAAVARAAPASEPEATSEPETATEVDESLVFLIQDRLNRLGYGEPTPLPLDGKLRKRTRLAIFDYQRKNELPETGQPSEELLRDLEATLLGRHGSAPSDGQ